MKSEFTKGKSLFGKDGAFAPLLQNFLDKASQAEMEAHLDADEHYNGNKRNGRVEPNKLGRGSQKLTFVLVMVESKDNPGNKNRKRPDKRVK